MDARRRSCRAAVGANARAWRESLPSNAVPSFNTARIAHRNRQIAKALMSRTVGLASSVAAVAGRHRNVSSNLVALRRSAVTLITDGPGLGQALDWTSLTVTRSLIWRWVFRLESLNNTCCQRRRQCPGWQSRSSNTVHVFDGDLDHPVGSRSALSPGTTSCRLAIAALQGRPLEPVQHHDVRVKHRVPVGLTRRSCP